MNTITWLHLSDFHFKSSQSEKSYTDIVLKPLIQDVRDRIKEDDLKPDFIIVSGDIAFSCQPEEYRLAGRFFDELLNATGAAKNRLFIVPGNHDVDRNAITGFDKGLLAQLSDQKKITELLNSPDYRKLVFRKFKPYADFVNEYFESQLAFDDQKNYYYARELKLANRRVGLLGLNSVWMSMADEERGHLTLGEPQVRNALEAIENCELRIAVLHHPFDSLQEFDRNASEPLLMQACDFILHGHLHGTGVSLQQSPDSRSMIIAAGSAYSGKEYANRYNFVKLDFSAAKGTVYLRLYSPNQGGFWTKDVTTYRNVPDGQYQFDLKFGPSVPLPERRVYSNLPNPDYRKFVGRKKELKLLNEFLSPQNPAGLAVVEGIGGIGKTSLALEIASRYLRNYDTIPFPQRFEAIIWTSAKISALSPGGPVPQLQPKRTLEDIYTTISTTLKREDIIRARSDEQNEVVIRALSKQRTLLILDNLETIADHRVTGFLKDLPIPTKAIITARVQQGFGQRIQVHNLSQAEGRELVLKECKKKGVKLSKKIAEELYKRTAGIPLAIVWCVGRIAFGYSINNTLDDLDNVDKDKVLSFLFREAVDNIRDPETIRLLQSLALFATDADREILQRVAEVGEKGLESGLATLIQLSLVNSDMEERYGLLPLAKRFALDRVDESYLTNTRSRQVECFLGFTKKRTLYNPIREEELEQVRLNLANIFDVLDWCYEAGKWEWVIDLVTMIQDYLAVAGYWQERIQWGHKAVEAARKIGDEKALGFLFVDTLGWVALTRGETDIAAKWVQTGLTYAQRKDDIEVKVMAMRYLNRLARGAGDFELAMGYLEKAEKIATNLSEGFKAGLAIDRAYHALARKDIREAEMWTERSRDGFEKMQDFVRSARKNVDLAKIYIEQQKLQEARKLLKKSIKMFERLGVRGTEDNLANAYHGLGRIETRGWNRVDARAYYWKALEIYRSLGAENKEGEIAEEIARLDAPESKLFVKIAEDNYQYLWVSAKESFARGKLNLYRHDIKNDIRRGLTLIARPSDDCKRCFDDLLKRLQKILPGQYYYDSRDFHITLLTLIDAYEEFKIDDRTLELYHQVLGEVISKFQPFEIIFRGIAVTESTIMAQGHFISNVINKIRETLRIELKAVGLGNTLDARYKNVTAHSVMVRFVKIPDKPLEAFRQLEAYREIDLGKTLVDTVYFVLNDWIMSHDRIRILHEYKIEKQEKT